MRKSSKFLTFWKEKARELKVQTYALYFAYRDPRVAWYAKGFILLVIAYAFSPVDLIPDFIPVLGYLDDLVLIPLGVVLALKMVPPQVMQECRLRAQEHLEEKPQYKFMGAVIIGIWIITILIIASFLFKAFRA